MGGKDLFDYVYYMHTYNKFGRKVDSKLGPQKKSGKRVVGLSPTLEVVADGIHLMLV